MKPSRDSWVRGNMSRSAERQGVEMTPDNPGAMERALLLRHRSGDAAAFAELVAEYRRPVYGYLVRSSVAESDRDDLFQEVFARVHAAAGRYDDDRPLHPWLFTIVANTVRTYHRKRRVRDGVFADHAEPEARADQADGERQAMARQTAAWLERRIPELPLAQREVLILTCIENLPQKEVAEILSLPLNTVKTNLRRARLTLARKLARHNAIDTDEVRS